MNIKAHGTMNGNACNSLESMTVGSYFTLNFGGFNETICSKATSEDAIPAEGKIFVMNFVTNNVHEVSSSLYPRTQYTGVFDSVNMRLVTEGSNISPAADTLENIELNHVFDNSNLMMRVKLLDSDNTEVDPGEGFYWVFKFVGSELIKMAVETSVESYGDSTLEIVTLE